MHPLLRHCIQLLALCVALVASGPVRADYEFTLVDYPDSVLTQLFGLNSIGTAVGVAILSDGSQRSFTYELTTGAFTDLPTAPGALATAIGINERGFVAGIANDDETFADRGFVLDENRSFTFFSHPRFENTAARAIGNTGLVTGYAYNFNFFDSAGFIYDPKRGTFIEIAFPDSENTVAQGINGRGDVVGSVNLPSGGAYPGSPSGAYSFLREDNGRITLFRVNDPDNPTRVRGISDAGLVAGDFADPGPRTVHAFVARLQPVGGFQLVNVAASDFFSVPGSIATIPEAIDNSGRIVGIAVDADGFLHGFVATPLRGKQ